MDASNLPGSSKDDRDQMPFIVALYPFHSNVPNELSFSAGEILTLVTAPSSLLPYYWCFARNQRGECGYVRRNFFTMMAHMGTSEVESGAMKPDPTTLNVAREVPTGVGELSSTTIKALNEYCLLRVFTHLHWRDLIALEAVSCQWRRVVLAGGWSRYKHFDDSQPQLKRDDPNHASPDSKLQADRPIISMGLQAFKLLRRCGSYVETLTCRLTLIRPLYSSDAITTLCPNVKHLTIRGDGSSTFTCINRSLRIVCSLQCWLASKNGCCIEAINKLLASWRKLEYLALDEIPLAYLAGYGRFHLPPNLKALFLNTSINDVYPWNVPMDNGGINSPAMPGAQLIFLHLATNTLSPSSVEWLAQLSNLRYLSISAQGQNEETLLSALGKVPHLKAICLRHPSTTLIRQLGSLDQLEHLTIVHSDRLLRYDNDGSMMELCSLPNLVSIRIESEGCYFVGQRWLWLFALANTRHLEHIECCGFEPDMELIEHLLRKSAEDRTRRERPYFYSDVYESDSKALRVLHCEGYFPKDYERLSAIAAEVDNPSNLPLPSIAMKKIVHRNENGREQDDAFDVVHGRLVFTPSVPDSHILKAHCYGHLSAGGPPRWWSDFA